MHITGIDNDGANALFRLDLTHKTGDLITWGEKNKVQNVLIMYKWHGKKMLT